MKKTKCMLACALSAALLVCALPATSLTQSEVEAASDPVVTELPGTDYTEVDAYTTSLLSVTGFATVGDYTVSDKTAYIGTDAYRTVGTEEEFLEALDDARTGEVKVIEITADLDLGWEALSEEAQSYTSISEYGWDITADTYNPGIIKSGVSKLNIVAPYGLTIFSKGGNTVKHAEWTLQTSSRDIVIRNLKFDGMWNWSEGASSKEAGWTLLKIYAKGVWIDHCSFTIAADGCVDTENGAEGVTMSWCTFSLPTDENPGTDSNLYQTVTYMEYMYQAGKLDTTGRYSLLRDNGATVNQIMAYEAYHNKCNLNGSGDKDFMDGYDSNGDSLENGNQRIHITMAYNYVTNIGQRFPLLRQGTMHLVNCYIDNSGHQALQSTEPFKSYGGWSSNRAINARDGASVGADNCVFNGLNAINGTEKHYEGYANMNEGWDVAFADAYNHALVVNSKVIYNGTTYIGSSWDNDGDNLFIENPSSYYNDGGSTIGDFHWFSSIDDVEQYTRGVVPTDADGNYLKFAFSYSEGEDNVLPYSYTKLALDAVEETIPTYSGAYIYNEEAEFWLRTEYEDGEDYEPVDDSVTVYATDLSLSDEAVSVDLDDCVQLTADVVPSYASEKEVTWTSSDTSVAEVLDSGLVIGVGSGTATITATTKDGTEIAKTCTVTVNVAVTSISIETSTKTVYLGDDSIPADSLQLTAVITPENATDTSVVWSSSSASVLTIDEDGVITPLKAGTSTVSATSVSNPSVVATVRITVKEGANPNATPVPSEDATETPSETEAATETPSETEAATETPSEEPVAYLYGDANDDTEVTAADALLILQEVVALADLPTGRIFIQSDVNGDGEITSSDALLVLQYVVQLVTVFPAEQ